MTFTLTSSAFQPGARIPKKHTGEDQDASPPLAWTGTPQGAKELALICDDPDAPRPKPFVHWVLYGLAPTLTGLKEGDHGGGVEGMNDAGGAGYGGPMPPPGHGVHHYYFRLYALDATLKTSPGWSKEQLLSEIKGHVLGTAELIGTYER